MKALLVDNPTVTTLTVGWDAIFPCVGRSELTQQISGKLEYGRRATQQQTLLICSGAAAPKSAAPPRQVVSVKPKTLWRAVSSRQHKKDNRLSSESIDGTDKFVAVTA